MNGLSRNCPGIAGGSSTKASESTAEYTIQKNENLFILIVKYSILPFLVAHSHNDAATATVLVHYQYFNNTGKVCVSTKEKERKQTKKKERNIEECRRRVPLPLPLHNEMKKDRKS